MSPLHFRKLKVLSDELVPAATPPAEEGKPSRALSDLDNSVFVIGYYGGGVASSETVDVPSLRLALSNALAKLPWFAGRFVLRDVSNQPAQYAIRWGCWSLRLSVPSSALLGSWSGDAPSHFLTTAALWNTLCVLGIATNALCAAHSTPCHVAEALD